jgi:signal peptidase I
MRSAYYPLRALEGLQIEETETEVIVFDSNNQKFHFLNSTAYTIFKACNGFNKIRDIVGILAREFDSDDLDSLENDVVETVGAFQEKGLMMFVADDPQLRQSSLASKTGSHLFGVSLTGTSMFPVLLSGDKVLVKRSSLEDLHAGDIIVWADESLQRVAHRIVSIDKSATPPLITTRGDLRLGEDPPVAFDQVLGKIVAVLRDGQVTWMTELDANIKSQPNKAGENGRKEQPSVDPVQPGRRPSYKKMKVLDLRDISVESIRNIESVEDISFVLLSPENAHAWAEVQARDVKTVFTAPKNYRIYTGQPELLPEMLEFLAEPLRIIVSGQLFVTAFEAKQLAKAFKELILIGQAYVSSVQAKEVLESLATIVSGEISVVPREHARWIGESILGPEFLSNSVQPPLVAVGGLAVSQRMGKVPENISLFE